MRILLTGASGQLGQSIIESAPKSLEILTPDKYELNLTDKDCCFRYVVKKKPDWIINCGAYTQVDKAEKEKELTLKINSEAPIALANALKNIGGKLIQISTDYVFSGENSFPISPNSDKKPINHYGYSKSLAEEGIEKILFKTNQGIILRTSWLIGPYKNNFLKKMLEFHEKKETINVVYDQISSPTSTNSLAKICWLIIQSFSEDSKVIDYPVLHWSNSGIASWYDLSFYIGEVAMELGLISKKTEVNPITSEQYITAAKRPNYSVLDSRITNSLFDLKSNHWQSEIKKICKKMKKENII